jgi:hypothetical protein
MLIPTGGTRSFHSAKHRELDAKAYLSSDMFTADVVGELGPLLAAAPEVRIYDEA